MTTKALFTGLVFDEYDNVLETTNVGQDACYIIDDAGFKRHILAQKIDRQVLEHMRNMMKGHEDIISEQAAKMFDMNDIFSRAILKEKLKNIDQEFDKILEVGLSEENRTFMGMMGFKIIINFHGEVVKISQPGTVEPE